MRAASKHYAKYFAHRSTGYGHTVPVRQEAAGILVEAFATAVRSGYHDDSPVIRGVVENRVNAAGGSLAALMY